MSTVNIVYWSGTGNTEAMANMLAEGVKAAGGEAKLLQVGEANAADLQNEKVFALGCPAMGAEVLEESEMEPFMAELEGGLSGKQLVLFGSYGWGDGEWMREWVDRVTKAGAVVLTGEGIMANDAPDDEAKKKCEEAGKLLAKAATSN